jgi:hypothetical protein
VAPAQTCSRLFPRSPQAPALRQLPLDLCFILSSWSRPPLLKKSLSSFRLRRRSSSKNTLTPSYPFSSFVFILQSSISLLSSPSRMPNYHAFSINSRRSLASSTSSRASLVPGSSRPDSSNELKDTDSEDDAENKLYSARAQRGSRSNKSRRVVLGQDGDRGALWMEYSRGKVRLSFGF